MPLTFILFEPATLLLLLAGILVVNLVRHFLKKAG